MNVRTLILIFVINFFFGSCNAQDNNRSQIFNEVIYHLEQNYFDKNFSGVSLDSLQHYYLDKVKKCDDDISFVKLINEMLFSFNVSHIGFGKSENIQNNASPYIWAKASIGIDVRIIDEKVIVTKVLENSEADKLGIKTGYEIISIDNVFVNEIFNRLTLRPQNNVRNHTFLKTEELVRKIYGDPNSNVEILFKKPSGNKILLNINRQERKGGEILFDGLPKVFCESKSLIFNDSIGYLSFNAFQPSDFNEVLIKLEALKKFPNLIIDIRGNNGGSVVALNRLASQLIKAKSLTYTLQNQTNQEYYTINQESKFYNGKVYILLDELSISAAEIFADLMQHTKSALIVGTQTPGNVLSGELFSLNEYNLLLPISSWVRNDGYILENNGVIPDIPVNLKREDLINGIDTQLQTIFDLIE